MIVAMAIGRWYKTTHSDFALVSQSLTDPLLSGQKLKDQLCENVAT